MGYAGSARVTTLRCRVLPERERCRYFQKLREFLQLLLSISAHTPYPARRRLPGGPALRGDCERQWGADDTADDPVGNRVAGDCAVRVGIRDRAVRCHLR